MYTFIVICVILFLVAGVVFKKKIKENQFTVYSIIIVGSLIGTTIINGMYGLEVPYSKVLHKEKIIKNGHSFFLYHGSDTIKMSSPLNYYYDTDSTGKITTNKLYVDRLDGYFDTTEVNKIKITLVEDTIPKLRIYKFRRSINNSWVTSLGLPSRGDREYEVLLPKNENNEKYVAYINRRYYGKEKI